MITVERNKEDKSVTSISIDGENLSCFRDEGFHLRRSQAAKVQVVELEPGYELIVKDKDSDHSDDGMGIVFRIRKAENGELHLIFLSDLHSEFDDWEGPEQQFLSTLTLNALELERQIVLKCVQNLDSVYLGVDFFPSSVLIRLHYIVKVGGNTLADIIAGGDRIRQEVKSRFSAI
ncbi:MAG: hypothetical protein ABSF91_11430 [Bacteroidota bacterium]|jgi:hypothetical protein